MRRTQFAEDVAVTEHEARRCRALVAAVVLTAIRDLTRVGDRDCAEPREPALRWIADDRKAPFSFEWCCDVLGLDPWYVRAIVKHKEAELAHAATCGHPPASVRHHAFGTPIPAWRASIRRGSLDVSLHA